MTENESETPEGQRREHIYIQLPTGAFYKIDLNQLQQFRMSDDQVEAFVREYLQLGTGPYTGQCGGYAYGAPAGFPFAPGPNAFMRATPNAFMRAVPGSFVRAVPGSFVRAVPGSFVRAEPGSFVRAVPNAFVRAVPGSFVRATPNAFVRAAPNSFVRVAPGTPGYSSVFHSWNAS